MSPHGPHPVSHVHFPSIRLPLSTRRMPHPPLPGCAEGPLHTSTTVYSLYRRARFPPEIDRVKTIIWRDQKHLRVLQQDLQQISSQQSNHQRKDHILPPGKTTCQELEGGCHEEDCRHPGTSGSTERELDVFCATRTLYQI